MKTILFCGDKSRLGFAFLRQFLLSDFNTLGVVLSTDKKWIALTEKYSGEKIGTYVLLNRRIKTVMKKFISQSMVSRIPGVYQKTLNAEVVLKKHKVPYWRVNDANSEEHIDKLKKIEPDLIMCAGFPQIFSRELLAIPKKGAVNVHPSLLPKFRGPSPFYWIIAKGEPESGITAHFMTENIDGGDIIAQIKFPILDMTCDDLIDKSIEETPKLIKQIHKFLTECKQPPQKQEESKASYFRYERENDCRLAWNQHDIHHIYNLTRTGKAFCFFRNRKIGITRCSISEWNPDASKDFRVENGTVIDASKDSILIQAMNGRIDVREFMYKGRKMPPHKLPRRLSIRIGERFT